jgi:hypothetical protein
MGMTLYRAFLSKGFPDLGATRKYIITAMVNTTPAKIRVSIDNMSWPS